MMNTSLTSSNRREDEVFYLAARRDADLEKTEEELGLDLDWL